LAAHPLLHYYSLFFFHCAGAHRDLPSFPTRRSSDLFPLGVVAEIYVRGRSAQAIAAAGAMLVILAFAGLIWGLLRGSGPQRPGRSEEHTSELQSPCNLVCRLLLEKKKTTKSQITTRD